jgi:hypothetical protein
MKRSLWSRPISLALVLSVPLVATTSGCSDDPTTNPGTPTSSGTGGNGAGGGNGGAGGEEMMRGPVSFTSSPVLEARVNDPYAYTAKAVQANAQPGDTITYALATKPEGMTINAQTGEVAWTPAFGQEGPQKVSITAAGTDGQSAQQDFTIEVEPGVAVARMQPAAGSSAGGELVTISGYGFVGNVGVLFGNVPAQDVMVMDEATISVTTPPAVARTRIVTITIDGTPQATFTPGFTHLPVLGSTDVATTKLASSLKVQGLGFDAAVVDPNQLVIPALASTRRKIVTSTAKANELAFSLGVGNSESTLATGAVAVEVHGLRSNFLPITISDASIPAELAVTGTDAPHAAGENMTLVGAGFIGVMPTDLKIQFAGAAAPAPVVSINPAGTQVVVTVPADAVTGPVSLEAPGRLPSRSHAAATITGTTPALAVLDATPAGGAPGSALVLRGTGFATDPAMNEVVFDGTAATVLSAEPDRLVVEVPAGLHFGSAEVVVKNGAETVSAGLFGVTGAFEAVGGGGPEEDDIGDGGDPMLASITGEYVTTDAANNYYIGDRKRVRVINNGAAPATMFGVTIQPGTIMTVAQASADVVAVAVHPVTEDVYFATNSAVHRAKRSDGMVEPYAGTGSAGNGGNKGPRLGASFSGITELRFTDDGGVLVIADNSNGAIRAINTTVTPTTAWGVPLGADIVDQIANMKGIVNPLGVAIDAEGSLYATFSTEVRKIAFDRPAVGAPGYVEYVTVAGNGLFTSLPAEGCPAITTSLGVNRGIAIDPVRGDAFIGSRHGLVRRIRPTGGVSPTTVDTNDCIDFVAGSWEMGKPIPNAGYGGDGGMAKDAVLALFSRPFTDRNGDLLVLADGHLRKVVFDAQGNPGIITTIAGTGPAPLDNLPALSLRSLNSLGGLRVDEAGNRYIYTVDGRVVAQDRDTNLLSVLAGTGYLGNRIGPNAMSTDSDLGALRGIEITPLGGLYLLEATIPRVSRIDLGQGTIGVIAGDGKTATAAEQMTAGVAISSRVAIDTGAPKAALGPSGALYFADHHVLRIMNPTDAPISTFGINLPSGGIYYLNGFGESLSGVAFAPNGDLYVASYDDDTIIRMRAAGPFTPEVVVAGDGTKHGVSTPGALAALHLNRPADLAFLPDGALLVANDFGNTLVHIEPDGTGDIGPESRFVHVFGSGAPGRMTKDDGAFAVAPRGVRAIAQEDQGLVLIAGERIVKLAMP